MQESNNHTFHIPVMGLGFTIDTPVKVAHFGITSVVSINEDELIEQMRAFYCKEYNLPYTLIRHNSEDSRAKRITAYLNLLNYIIDLRFEVLKNEAFNLNSDIVKYFELLPEKTPAKIEYTNWKNSTDKAVRLEIENKLRSFLLKGSIDVNIMSKVDKTNYDNNGEPLPQEYSDAHAALRGFANSKLSASVVFSAGYNPRLFGYLENFEDFYPDKNGYIKKKVIIKVSDFRSAYIQSRLLAKKGIWVSEFRIESGLNCGGHAFATDGLLLGPILEEFKNRKFEVSEELFNTCNKVLEAKSRPIFNEIPKLKISVQGGIGTSNENEFLLDHYDVDMTGWGSPFLLVPEATNVDEFTLEQLTKAKQEDYYLSNASPLGVPFNNFRRSSSEIQRQARIEKNRPGSPCYKKVLAFSNEYGKTPLCTASRAYQHFKIKDLNALDLPESERQNAIEEITEKDCLCEGLAVSALLNKNITVKHKLNAVTICPGPNLAYFSNVFSLKQMVDHIYGRTNILNSLKRPHMFNNELNLYLDYFKKNLLKKLENKAEITYVETFTANLNKGIEYYSELINQIKNESVSYINQFKIDLAENKAQLENLINELKIQIFKTSLT